MRGDVRGGAPTPSLPVGCGCFPARKGGGAHAGGEVGGGGGPGGVMDTGVTGGRQRLRGEESG